MCDVIDFKSKKKLLKENEEKWTKEKQNPLAEVEPEIKDKLCDADWVSDEITKVINKSFNKKIDALNIAIALTDVTVQFVHDFAPNTANAQHLLLTAIQQEMEMQMDEEYIEDE